MEQWVMGAVTLIIAVAGWVYYEIRNKMAERGRK